MMCIEDVASMFPGSTDPASIVFRRESELLAGCEDPGQPYLTWVLPEKVGTAEECVTQRSLALNLSPRGRTLGAVFFSGTAPPALRPCLESGKGIASGFEEPRNLTPRSGSNVRMTSYRNKIGSEEGDRQKWQPAMSRR